MKSAPWALSLSVQSLCPCAHYVESGLWEFDCTLRLQPNLGSYQASVSVTSQSPPLPVNWPPYPLQMLFPMCNCGLSSHVRDPRAPAGSGAARDRQKPPVSKSSHLNTEALLSPNKSQYCFFFFLFGRNAVCLCDLSTYCCPQKEPLLMSASNSESYSGQCTLWWSFGDMASTGHTWIWINSRNVIKLSCNSLNIFYGPFEMTYLTLPKGHFCA